MYGQRGIAAMLDICKDIREVAEPDALLLNYANPMAMLTWACNKYGGVRTIGLCHGVQGGHQQIAEAFGLTQEGGRHHLRRHQPPDLVCVRSSTRARI